jgi:hypothetical protein
MKLLINFGAVGGVGAHRVQLDDDVLTGKDVKELLELGTHDRLYSGAVFVRAADTLEAQGILDGATLTVYKASPDQLAHRAGRRVDRIHAAGREARSRCHPRVELAVLAEGLAGRQMTAKVGAQLGGKLDELLNCTRGTAAAKAQAVAKRQATMAAKKAAFAAACGHSGVCFVRGRLVGLSGCGGCGVCGGCGAPPQAAAAGGGAPSSSTAASAAAPAAAGAPVAPGGGVPQVA